MRVDLDLTNFSAGELSPRMAGRTDIAKYFNGCEALLNFVAMPQGGVTRRPGTMYVATVGAPATPARLLPFIFSTEQAYVIELGANYARFYANDGQVQSGGAPVQIATPYAAADLAAIQYTQSADTLYLCHPSYAAQALTRSSPTAWAITPLTFRDGPYLAVNTGTTTLTLSAATGSVTVTASSIVGINATPGNTGQGFLPTDVGRHLRVRLQSLWGWLVITAVTSTTVVTATVQAAVPNGAFAMDGAPWTGSTWYPVGAIAVNGGTTYKVTVGGLSAATGGPTGSGGTDGTVTWVSVAAVPLVTTQWQLGKWSGAATPYNPMFWQNRLMLCGSNDEPNAIEGSVTGDFTNFAPTQSDGSVTAVNALSWIISDDEVNAIRWLSPAGSAQAMQLGIGTTGGEDILQAASTAQALSPTNVTAYRETSLGSAPNVRPLRILKSVLFANRPGRKLHEWTFQWMVNGYVGPDLAVLSEHITVSGIAQLAYQQNPYGVVWAIRNDGALIGLTYLRDQDVVAWHRHQLGGQYYGGPPIVESLAVIPSPDGTYDELWLEVLRTVAGVPVRFVEVMTRYFDAMPLEQAWCVDAGLANVLGTPAATLTPTGFVNQATAIGATAAFGGAGTLAASAAVFAAGDVGQVVRANGGRLLLTGYTDAQHVAAQALAPLATLEPAASGTWTMGAAFTAFGGLGYLTGETAAILGDGQVFTDQVVTAGSVTMSGLGASYAIAGLPYASLLVTMPAAPLRAAQVSSAGKVKRIDTVYVRFLDAVGGLFGVRQTDPMTLAQEDKTEEIWSRSAADPMGEPVALLTGIRRLKMPGGYDQEAQILVAQEEPLPMTVLAVSARIDVAEIAAP